MKPRYFLVGRWGDWYVWLRLLNGGHNGAELVKRRVDRFWSK
jgi:hypothetical protein